MTRFLGIDGGGSRTRFLLVEDDREIARLETAGSNYVALGAEASRRAIAEGLDRLPAAPAVVCGGFAGAGRPEGRRHYETTLRELLPQATVFVETDALIAYVGALGFEPGLLLLAGTGSIVIGRQPDGVMFRAGGWGSQFGDEGGGFWIGREAVRAALEGFDFERLPDFQQKIAGALGLHSLPEVVTAWRSGAVGTTEIAALARIVLESYPDPPAKAILEEAAARLRRLVLDATERLGGGTPRLAAAGGVATHPLMARLLGLPLAAPEAPPEWGAIRWAQRRLENGET